MLLQFRIFVFIVVRYFTISVIPADAGIQFFFIMCRFKRTGTRFSRGERRVGLGFSFLNAESAA